MNASEARKITDENLNGIVIEKYTVEIDERIREAALEGKSSIHNPQACEAGYLHGDECKAVKQSYTASLYEWLDHDDPDPGNPCGGAYTTLSW